VRTSKAREVSIFPTYLYLYAICITRTHISDQTAENPFIGSCMYKAVLSLILSIFSTFFLAMYASLAHQLRSKKTRHQKKKQSNQSIDTIHACLALLRHHPVHSSTDTIPYPRTPTSQSTSDINHAYMPAPTIHPLQDPTKQSS